MSEQRERFEEWLSGSEWFGLTFKREGESYTDGSTQLAWEAWQAAIKAGRIPVVVLGGGHE